MKFQFSGHESFICKQFWLKKGYDYIQSDGNFNDETAVIRLGVGKNMVTSISYWLKSFGITDNVGNATWLGDFLFNNLNGKDPYVENIGTLWLLHYSLIKTNKASLYNLFFNDFRKGKSEFTKDQFAKYVNRQLEITSQNGVSANTVSGDISVFIRNYLKPDYKNGKSDIEDDFSNLFLDLELMTSYQSENADGKNVEWYKLENAIRPDLPYEIVLYTILDNLDFGKSIPFKDLLTSPNSPGAIFALNEDGLYRKIEEIEKKYKKITYTETAGVRELQIHGDFNKQEILNAYYKN